MADYDLTGINLSVEIGGQTQATKDFDKLIKQLEKMGVNVKVEMDSKKVEDQAQKIKHKITQVMDSAKINPELNQQAFSDLYGRLRKVRGEVDELAKVDVMTDKNNNIQKAILTYQDGMGKIVTETMAWKTVLDEATSTMTRTFETQGFKYSDNIAKEQSIILKENIEREKTLISLNEQRYNLNKQVSALMKDSSFRGTDEYKDMAEINAQIKAIKQSEGAIDKEQLTNVQKMISELKIKLDIESRYLSQKDKEENIQTKINNQLKEISTLKGNKFISEEDVERLNEVEGKLKKFKTNSTDASHELGKLSGEIKDVGLNTKAIEKLTIENNRLEKSTFDARLQQESLNESVRKLKETKIAYDTDGLDSFVKRLNQIDIESEDAKQQLQELQKEFVRLNNSANEMSGKAGLINSSKSQIGKLDGITIANDKFSEGDYSRIKTAYESLIKEIESGNITLAQAKIKYDQLSPELKEFENAAKKASDTTNSLSDRIKRYFQFNVVSDAVQLMKRGIREVVETVGELDSSLVELQKVSDLTGDSLEDVTNRAFAMGNTLARTGKDVIDAVTTAKRAGYDMEESFKLGEQALVMTNVAENIKSVEDASGSLVAVLRGYGMEVDKVTHLVDAFNEVSNTQAVNFDDLVEGATRISGVMNQQGNSFEEMLGLITGGTEILRDVEKVSSGIQTITMRLAGMTEEGEKLDSKVVSKMTDEFERLAGVSLVDTSGQIRDTYDILADMAKVMPTLEKNTRQYLLELASGKRQANVLEAILTNWENVQKSVDSATNSYGSSEKEMEKYLNSIEGKTNQLKSNLQELSINFISSDTVKGVIDLTNNILELIDACGGLNTVILALGTSFAIFKFAPMISGAGLLAESIGMLTLKTTGLALSMGTLNTIMSVSLTGVAIGGILALGAGIKYMAEETERAKERITNLESEMSSLNTEYESLKSKQTLTDSEKDRVTYLEKELSIREQILAIENQELAKKETFGTWYDSGNLQKSKVVISEIQIIEGEIDRLNEKLSNPDISNEEYVKYSRDVSTKTGELLSKRQKLEEVNNSLAESSKYLQGQDKEYLESQKKVIDSTLDVINKTYILESSIGGAGETINDTSNGIDDMTNKLEKLSSAYDDNVDSCELLNSAINSINDGQTLTGETIVELLEKYPELRNQLTLTEKGYTLNKEELVRLRDQSVDTFNTMIDKEVASAEVAIQSAKDRIRANEAEIESIYKLAQAENLLFGIKNKNKVAMGYDSLTTDSVTKNAISTIESEINKDKAALQSNLELLEKLKNDKQNFNILASGANTKKGSNISNKKSKSDNPFQKEIDGIKQAREEIEREIAIIQSKLDLSEMQGDSKAFDEYSNKMTLLLAKQKELADVEVSKFNALKGKYKKEEEQLTLNELISESTKAKYTDEKEYLEQTISLIQRKTDLEESAYDDKLRQIELSQMLMDDNSDEYIQSEELKMTMLLEKQSQYQEKILALKKTGLSDESTMVREYIKLHNDAEVERLNIFKSLAEKRRQLEIENLNTQKDQLQKQYDAKKSLLDMTIEILKEEGKAKQQALKDEISNMKEIADEKKRILKQEQADRKFNKEVDSANEEINSIQNDINKLMFDNSDWAIAERARLEKELKEKQVALDDKYYDDKIDKEINTIDEQVSLFEKQKNKELEVIEKTQLDEVALKKKALDMMDRNNKELYNKLKKYNSETLKMSQVEFDKTWESANKGLENFGINSNSTLEIMYDMADAMQKLAEQAEILGNTPLTYDTTINTPSTGKPTGEEWYKKRDENATKMKANSEKWFDATPEEKDRLAKENTQLAQTIGAWKGSDGEWYIMVNGKRMKLYDSIGVRHNGILGGFTGNGMLPNEVLIKATTDEIVLNKGQQDILTKNIIGLKNKQTQMPPIQLNFNGTVTEGAKPLLRDFKREIEDVVYRIVNDSL